MTVIVILTSVGLTVCQIRLRGDWCLPWDFLVVFVCIRWFEKMSTCIDDFFNAGPVF